MTSTPVPVLEPDAAVYQVPAQPRLGEPGAITVARDLARHLRTLLKLPIGPPVYRENPWDRRACPRAWSYELTAGRHHILVTAFEATHPLIRGPVTEYAINLGGEPIRFERLTYAEAVEWQIARAIWIALTDRQDAPGEANQP